MTATIEPVTILGGKLTVLGTTLIRQGPNQWEWCDGTPEPRVRDLTPSMHYHFPRRRVCGVPCVEIPFIQVIDDPHLRRLLDGPHMSGWTKRRPRQQVLLVPLENWQPWAEAYAMSAIWPAEHDREIRAKADSLRWTR